MTKTITNPTVPPRAVWHTHPAVEKPPAAYLSNLDRFVRSEFVDLNNALETGEIGFSDWMIPVRSAVDGVARAVAELEGRSEREHLFVLLAFVGSAAEHHAQILDRLQPGVILRSLPGVERALLTLSATLTRSPWLTAYDLWDTNRTPILSFTNAAHHNVFHLSVRVQIQAHREINRILRDFTDDEYKFGTSAAVIMMGIAADIAKKTRSQYHTMTHDITPLEFLEFRNWLVPTVIGGKLVKNANAAWLYPMPRTDILLGVASQKFVDEYTRPYATYFSGEDAALLDNDTKRRSVFDAAADALGMHDANTLSYAADADVIAAVTSVDMRTRVTLEALTATWTELVGATNAHIAQIKRCMERVELTPEVLARMPVPPTEGTGGNSMAQLRYVQEMRKNFMPGKKLASALRATAA